MRLLYSYGLGQRYEDGGQEQLIDLRTLETIGYNTLYLDSIGEPYIILTGATLESRFGYKAPSINPIELHEVLLYLEDQRSNPNVDAEKEAIEGLISLYNLQPLALGSGYCHRFTLIPKNN